MLTQLSIHDFAIIDRLELNFAAGLSVFTGETGAGKSILFDALQLALGARGDSDTVRQQSPRAEVSAVFDLTHRPEVVKWLEEEALDGANEVILRRVINADGRSRAWINGSSVPVQSLRALGNQLVEVHGQHEHQQLLHGRGALHVVDAFAKHQTALDALAEGYRLWHSAQQALQQLQGTAVLTPAELELLRYQIEELEAVAPLVGELEELHAEQRRLANAETLLHTTAEAIEWIDGEDPRNAVKGLSRALHLLGPWLSLGTPLQEARQLLEEARIQAQEAATLVTKFQDQISVDPNRLQQAENHLSRIYELARKHRSEPAALVEKLAALNQRVSAASDAGQREVALRETLTKCQLTYQAAALQLSKRRRKASTRLGRSVSESMAQLGMAGGLFNIEVKHDEHADFRALGQDTVTFLVSANPGQTPRPLTKVASGGELSRISLALKVALLDVDNPSSMIFDEVDAGVGGATAQIVGEKLRAVAEDRQVFCVTHLPQVAACGHHHYRVEKDGARVSVERLADEQRNKEIARMLGGIDITDRSTAHAKEMLEIARQSR